MRTRLTDVISRPTPFVRAIPAVRIRCGADFIFRMVLCFIRAIPEMSAVFVRREDPFARLAHAIACDIGIRSGVPLLISRAIPGMIATGIQSVGCFARFAIP